MDISKIMGAVPNHEAFLTVDQLNVLMHKRAREFSLEVKQFGKSSVSGESLHYLKMGSGKKVALVWGFPHPNEPIGTLLIDFLVEYFGRHPDVLKETDYTWYFVYNADPEGARLNESWFGKPFSLMHYFNGFYRPPANRMIDWTFPIEYENAKWNQPLEETKALMGLIDELKPELMYPLHNAGFEAAYFLSTRKFSPGYYERIKEHYRELGIPLNMGEPEEPFMHAIERPFYYDFGFKDYYDHRKKTGGSDTFLHGDNSTGYLLRVKPSAVVLKAEVCYFLTPALENQNQSELTRRDVWLSYLDIVDKHRELVAPFAEKALEKLKAPHPHFYLMEDFMRGFRAKNSAFREHIRTSAEYEAGATEAEVTTGIIGSYFYGGGLKFAQVRRAALAAGLDQQDILFLEEKMKECADVLDRELDYKAFPIRTLVQAQLVYLLETLEELKTL